MFGGSEVWMLRTLRALLSCADTALRQRLGEAGRLGVQESFSFELMLVRLEKLFSRESRR